MSKEMDSVGEMMERMQLSAAEMKEIKIGSDSLSWRKDDLARDGKKDSADGREEEEVTSPIKPVTNKEGDGAAKKALFLGNSGEEGVGDKEQLQRQKKGEVKAADNMQSMQVDEAEDGRGRNVDQEEIVQQQVGLKGKKEGNIQKKATGKSS
ncbi:hypothetical protein C2845_PM05G15280 [Panicum miliaceum]|uniref:Uncharacterized protein n=1 Tax=Panicum miliaceum TaxID=4540 RepID=A0A3L6SYX9_PANMI|nr:hypothetical protein C2845_PM05G15280 [Panicum miliaceum]